MILIRSPLSMTPHKPDELHAAGVYPSARAKGTVGRLFGRRQTDASRKRTSWHGIAGVASRAESGGLARDVPRLRDRPFDFFPRHRTLDLPVVPREAEFASNHVDTAETP